MIVRAPAFLQQRKFPNALNVVRCRRPGTLSHSKTATQHMKHRRSISCTSKYFCFNFQHNTTEQCPRLQLHCHCPGLLLLRAFPRWRHITHPANCPMASSVLPTLTVPWRLMWSWEMLVCVGVVCLGSVIGAVWWFYLIVSSHQMPSFFPSPQVFGPRAMEQVHKFGECRVSGCFQGSIL